MHIEWAIQRLPSTRFENMFKLVVIVYIFVKHFFTARLLALPLQLDSKNEWSKQKNKNTEFM